jgi:hypothetical protein
MKPAAALPRREKWESIYDARQSLAGKGNLFAPRTAGMAAFANRGGRER